MTSYLKMLFLWLLDEEWTTSADCRTYIATVMTKPHNTNYAVTFLLTHDIADVMQTVEFPMTLTSRDTLRSYFLLVWQNYAVCGISKEFPNLKWQLRSHFLLMRVIADVMQTVEFPMTHACGIPKIRILTTPIALSDLRLIRSHVVAIID